MSLAVLLTLTVVGVPVLLVLLVAVALWVRTVRARCRATISRIPEDAPQLPQHDDGNEPPTAEPTGSRGLFVS